MVAVRWASVMAFCLWCAPLAAQSPENPLGIRGGQRPGTLVICGGGRLREDVYREFIRLAGGKNAHLVHIPSAYDFSSPAAVRNRYSGWLSYDVASFTFLDAKDSEEADTDEFAEPLRRATGVWIGGGTQGRLANIYNGTKAQAALHEVLERGGVVGGTSAGASIMSNCMIRYGSPSEAVCDQGFGLVSHCVIDQHFAERNRLPRLLGALEANQGQVGFGIDEGTAVIVRQNRLKVMGASRATICLPAAGDGVTLHRLSDGEEAQIMLAGESAKTRLAWELKRVK